MTHWLLCRRCQHPYDWHRFDDARVLELTDPKTPFRCLGFDPAVDNFDSGHTCDCPDLIRDPVSRLPTPAEVNIARAWVVAHHWTDIRDATAELKHALELLVFANARPPRRHSGSTEGQP
jgi:hypothetical protein